jgi:hypothetical protein
MADVHELVPLYVDGAVNRSRWLRWPRTAVAYVDRRAAYARALVR